MNYERESQLSGCGFALFVAVAVTGAVVLSIAATLAGGWWS